MGAKFEVSSFTRSVSAHAL